MNDESGCFAVLCRLVGCKAEIRDMDIKPARRSNVHPRIRVRKQVGVVGIAIAMRMDEERGVYCHNAVGI